MFREKKSLQIMRRYTQKLIIKPNEDYLCVL